MQKTVLKLKLPGYEPSENKLYAARYKKPVMIEGIKYNKNDIAVFPMPQNPESRALVFSQKNIEVKPLCEFVPDYDPAQHYNAVFIHCEDKAAIIALQPIMPFIRASFIFIYHKRNKGEDYFEEVFYCLRDYENIWYKDYHDPLPIIYRSRTKSRIVSRIPLESKTIIDLLTQYKNSTK